MEAIVVAVVASGSGGGFGRGGSQAFHTFRSSRSAEIGRCSNPSRTASVRKTRPSTRLAGALRVGGQGFPGSAFSFAVASYDLGDEALGVRGLGFGGLRRV